jgi:hypothetical protein
MQRRRRDRRDGLGLRRSLVGCRPPNSKVAVLKIEPATQLLPSPLKAGITETVYTKLRNELAHKRVGADLDATKNAMAEQLHALRQVVRTAIAK